MQDDPALPLTDNGKGKRLRPGRPESKRPVRVARMKLWRVPLVMLILFTGAVAGMYFQGPGLPPFLG
jgi:HlyD family secretion protein